MAFDKLAKIAEAADLDAKNINIYDFPDEGAEPVTSAEGTDIVTISYKNVEMYISNAYKTLQSLLLYGDPGLGKSTVVLNTAKKLAASVGKTFVNWQDISDEQKQEIMQTPAKYFVFVDVRTAQLEPSDLVGIPNIQNKERWLETLPQKWVYLMTQPNSAGILFLDEINQGSPQILRALYQVVLDRGVGNLKFTNGWGVMAAGNLGSEFNDPLPQALTNRFLAGKLVADPVSWIKYAHEKGVDDTIVMFVESRPEENFYKKPEAGTSNQFPSPRQFFALSKQIDHIKQEYHAAKQAGNAIEQSIYKTIGDTAAQLCGVNWAQRYVTFLRYAKLFDWASIAKEPKKYIKSGKGTASTDVDQLYQIVLVVRDAIVKYLGEQSTLAPDERLKFCRDLVGVYNEFNFEFRTILLSYINKKDKSASTEFLATIMRNKTVEPFKTFLDKSLPEIIKISKGA